MAVVMAEGGPIPGRVVFSFCSVTVWLKTVTRIGRHTRGYSVEKYIIYLQKYMYIYKLKTIKKTTLLVERVRESERVRE